MIAVLVVILIGACATKRDVVVSKLRGRGTGRVYPVTADQAWNISKAILRLEPTEAIEEHRTDGYMLTSDASASLAPSTYMGVFVEPVAPGETKVTFVTRRRSPTQGYVSLTEGGFHRKFAELLGLIASTCPLPPGSGLGTTDRASGCPTLPETDRSRGAPAGPDAGSGDAAP